MEKKATIVVRPGRSGFTVKMPSGTRFYTLDRATFDRAVIHAEAHISGYKPTNKDAGAALLGRLGKSLKVP